MKTIAFAVLGVLSAAGCVSVQPKNPDPPPQQPPRVLTPDERQYLAGREQTLSAQLDRERAETARLRARLAELERMRKDR